MLHARRASLSVDTFLNRKYLPGTLARWRAGRRSGRRPFRVVSRLRCRVAVFIAPSLASSRFQSRRPRSTSLIEPQARAVPALKYQPLRFRYSARTDARHADFLSSRRRGLSPLAKLAYMRRGFTTPQSLCRRRRHDYDAVFSVGRRHLLISFSAHASRWHSRPQPKLAVTAGFSPGFSFCWRVSADDETEPCRS